MGPIRRLGLAALLGGIATMAPAQDTVERVATQTDWSLFVEDDPRQCWMVSAPKKTVNTRDGRVVAVRRGDIFLMVSFWPDKGDVGEVSFMGGYPFAEGSTVELTVGDESYDLFTEGEIAWATNSEADQRIAEAMKAGLEAVVVGRSSRGTTTTDTFSLMGFTAAYDDSQDRCAE